MANIEWRRSADNAARQPSASTGAQGVAAAIVRVLQRSGVLFSHCQHAKHHAPPYMSNYCIAVGWCNGRLVRTQFFPRFERLITKATGVVPREDEAHRNYSVV